MHRNEILSLLKQYRERFPSEGECVREIEKFILDNTNCFHRDSLEGHLTGSAWIVSKDLKKVLLTHHVKLDKWIQLGGHADGEPDLLSVALREAYEESGLEEIRRLEHRIFDIDIHLIPEYEDVPEHFHYDICFIFQTIGSEKIEISDESYDLKWVNVKELEKFTTEPSMLRMQKKWNKIYRICREMAASTARKQHNKVRKLS